MEKRHATIISERFPKAVESKQVHCLGIPDEYEFMDEDLVAMLRAAVKEFI